ncbi:tetratricopeptide repeat protein [Rothia nasimurium]|uniref:tetratricopeptide repeat protein n=2 Tax=Rothia nasimurium TaxID=85336 RepID=UPI001F32182C|nr:tetratricopeptide repeat protein [Rothia nasimurium]
MTQNLTPLEEADRELARAQELIAAGQLTDALPALQAAAGGFESAGEVFGQILALKILSEVNRDLGNLAPALTEVTRAHALLADAKPDAEQLPDFATEVGSLHAELGDFERSKTWYTQGLRGYEAQGNVEGRAHNLVALAGLARQAQDEAGAQGYLAQAYELYAAGNHTVQLMHVRNAQAQGLLAVGDTDAARPLLTEALDLAQELDDQAFLAETYQLLALVTAQSGDADAAQGYLERSAEHYAAAGDTDNEAFVKELLESLEKQA